MISQTTSLTERTVTTTVRLDTKDIVEFLKDLGMDIQAKDTVKIQTESEGLMANDNMLCVTITRKTITHG